MPFLDAGQAATFKDFYGLDVTCQNQWDISVATDPQDITTLEPVATVHRTTYGLGRVTMTGYSTHISAKTFLFPAWASKNREYSYPLQCYGGWMIYGHATIGDIYDVAQRMRERDYQK